MICEYLLGWLYHQFLLTTFSHLISASKAVSLKSQLHYHLILHQLVDLSYIFTDNTLWGFRECLGLILIIYFQSIVIIYDYQPMVMVGFSGICNSKIYSEAPFSYSPLIKFLNVMDLVEKYLKYGQPWSPQHFPHLQSLPPFSQRPSTLWFHTFNLSFILCIILFLYLYNQSFLNH